MIVMGIDPGTTTGVAWYDDVEDVMQGKEIKCFATYKEKDQAWRGKELNAVFTITTLVMDIRPDVIVIEDFILRNGGGGRGARHGLSPVRIGSMLYAMLELMDEEYTPTIVFQTPSEMSVITNERLKRAGYWLVGSEHNRDAAKHALVQYRKLRGRGVVR